MMQSENARPSPNPVAVPTPGLAAQGGHVANVTGAGDGVQSACLRRKAGISISSMPLLARVSTLVRALRHTLGVSRAV